MGYFSLHSSRSAGLGIRSLPPVPLGAMCWLLLGVILWFCGTSTFSCQPLLVFGPGPQLQLPPHALPGPVSVAAAPSHSSFASPASTGGCCGPEVLCPEGPPTLVLVSLAQGKEGVE